MKEVTLSQPSTLIFDWFESDNRQIHTLWVQVDFCQIFPDESIAWIDGNALQEAIAAGELPHGTSPNWFHVLLEEDEGTIGSIFKSNELVGSAITGGPVQRFVDHQLQLKLDSLRQRGKPPKASLKKFKLNSVSPLDSTPLWFRAEACHEGILINPILPASFEDQEPDELTLVEKKYWWNRPFIHAREPEVGIESYDSYASRTITVGGQPMTSHEWADNQASIRANWMKRFPSGLAFDVRCLDGRTGNTPTWWGDADSLEAALEIVRCKRPTWHLQENQTSPGGSHHGAL